MTRLAVINLFSGWWEALTLPQQVFYGVGIVAAFTALLLAGLAIFGLEHHDGVDDIGADPDAGNSILSVKPLTGFFLGFGWAGGLAMENGFSLPVALVFAFGAGGLVMTGIVLMFRAIMAMRSDGTARIDDAVGAVGTVYISLPPGKAAGGQVIVSFRGRQETFAALNSADRSVPSGERVKVISVVDPRTVLVEPLA